jgi:hypothetical protein
MGVMEVGLVVWAKEQGVMRGKHALLPDGAPLGFTLRPSKAAARH